MIRSAKVNLNAVKKLEEQEMLIKEFHSFGTGIENLGSFLQYIADQIELLTTSLDNLYDAKDVIIDKREETKEKISDLEEKISDLEDQLDSLESELFVIDEYIEVGESQIPNPAYSLIESEISSVNLLISAAKADLSVQQLRYDKIERVENKLVSQIPGVEGIIYSLREKSNRCRKMITELETIKNLNTTTSDIAYINLRKIEVVIDEYLNTKMDYDDTVISSGYDLFSQNNHFGGIKVEPFETNEFMESSHDQGDYFDNEEDLTMEPRVSFRDGIQYGGEYNSYEDRLNCTPKEDNNLLGKYEGKRGESLFVPSANTEEGKIVIQILSEYGANGIEYINAEPAFEVCSEEIVVITGMTENREDYYDKDGVPRLGNFTQADIACAKQWNTNERYGKADWTARDVFEYRKTHNLTWHEKCDTKTMVLVRAEINAYFRHSGGCSECKKRDNAGFGGEFDE